MYIVNTLMSNSVFQATLQPINSNNNLSSNLCANNSRDKHDIELASSQYSSVCETIAWKCAIQDIRQSGITGTYFTFNEYFVTCLLQCFCAMNIFSSSLCIYLCCITVRYLRIGSESSEINIILDVIELLDIISPPAFT